MNFILHPSPGFLILHPSPFILHPTMNHCPIHYATMQKSPTYHRSAIDPATTAIAEAGGHLLANSLLANLAQVMCTGHYEEGVHLALKYTPCFEVWL